MNYFEFKESLQKLTNLAFILPNGISFPSHFHITEVGRTQKQFIDCGGVVRNLSEISLQLWLADDAEHRLSPQKLMRILEETENKIILPDENVVVELQGQTIEKYSLTLDELGFLLHPTQTACLAEDSCGIPKEKLKVVIGQKNECKPGAGCC
jgi:hypothetical protein